MNKIKDADLMYVSGGTNENLQTNDSDDCIPCDEPTIINPSSGDSTKYEVSPNY
ncbi:MAG: hypothetical protein IJ583_05200 [Firmicutes bacterium]|nr:hypothetical protein [Bacillota bacterium]